MTGSRVEMERGVGVATKLNPSACVKRMKLSVQKEAAILMLLGSRDVFFRRVDGGMHASTGELLLYCANWFIQTDGCFFLLALISDCSSICLIDIDRQPALHDQKHDASSLPNASQSIGTNSLSIGPIANCLAAKPYHRVIRPLNSPLFPSTVQYRGTGTATSSMMKSQGRLRTCYTRGPAGRHPESGYSIPWSMPLENPGRSTDTHVCIYFVRR